MHGAAAPGTRAIRRHPAHHARSRPCWYGCRPRAPWVSRITQRELHYGVVFGTSVSKWLVLTALAILLWVARGVLPPFIVAVILAYVLSPLVDELAARSGVRRPLVALGIFC